MARYMDLQKRDPADHVRMLMVAERTRERPPTIGMVRDSVPASRPTAHGHSWVRYSGRSHLPGHMVAVGTIFSADCCVYRGSVAIFVRFGAFCQVFRLQFTMWPFFRIMRSVLARERLPTCLMLRGSVSVAWPMVHGHSQVQRPGRGGLPGANRRPLRI